MPTPSDLRKQFIKTFDRLAHHRQRHDVFSDFLTLAVCAIRKTTMPAGEQADAIEAEYMAVVKRNNPDDIRAMPELLGITALAVQDGGQDFLGSVVGELELLNSHMGQFFTPYDLSRLMAEISFEGVDEVIAAKGFVTVQEPACGAGGMILAAADVLAAKGHDIGQTLYVDATDLAPMCFRMSYLQASLRGIPATIRRGNTLSLEMFESARTPAFLPFYLQHREAFLAWQEEASAKPAPRELQLTPQSNRTSRPPAHFASDPPRPKATPVKGQLNLFDAD